MHDGMDDGVRRPTRHSCPSEYVLDIRKIPKRFQVQIYSNVPTKTRLDAPDTGGNAFPGCRLRLPEACVQSGSARPGLGTSRPL